jgi:Protein of unknown function (DUF3592)
MGRSQTMASRTSIIPYLRRTPLLWIGVIILLPGLVFATLGVALAIQDARFSAGGATAVGIVLSKDIKPATQHTSTSYSIRYRFTASNDRTYEGSSTIDVHDWERLVERGPVTVQYLVSDPSSSRLSTAGNLIFEVVFLVIGLALLLVGGYLVVRSSRTLIEDWRLMRVGIEASATVGAVEATNLRINRRVQWEISYAYRDVSGKEYEGRSWTMPEGEARKFRPGDHGTIRYDPERPAQSLWIHNVRLARPDVSGPNESAAPLNGPSATS